jgi:hypothetical protein
VLEGADVDDLGGRRDANDLLGDPYSAQVSIRQSDDPFDSRRSQAPLRDRRSAHVMCHHLMHESVPERTDDANDPRPRRRPRR